MKPRFLLREALRLADGSRRLIRRALDRGFKVRAKSDKSPVTDADLAVERFLRRELSRRFPDHGILGEEFPERNPGAEYQWILDPIDGTLSFTRGIPLFGTLIALQRRGQPLVGVIDHPALGERCWAAAGLGAFRNGRRVILKDLPPGARVEREVLAACDRAQFSRVGREKVFDRLSRSLPHLRVYSDCFGHTLAMSGAVGAMVDYGIKIWDIAASQVIIPEAGGRFEIVERLGEAYNTVLGKPRAVSWLLKRL